MIFVNAALAFVLQVGGIKTESSEYHYYVAKLQFFLKKDEKKKKNQTL